MKRLSVLLLLLVCGAAARAQAVDGGCGQRYVEVTGSSVIEIDPDEVHFIITISEYWQEEFDGKSKPEDYRTKVPLTTIESGLRRTLAGLGTISVLRRSANGGASGARIFLFRSSSISACRASTV